MRHCSRCATSVEHRYRRFDILINAAGFTKPLPHADLETLTDELIDRMFQVNWRGQFATIRTFAPLLKASRDGVIFSISSIAAFTGVGSSIAYCVAKAGIDVMTKTLARALAPEVRVLAVSPGVRRYHVCARPGCRLQRQGRGFDAVEANRRRRRYRGCHHRLHYDARLFDRSYRAGGWRARPLVIDRDSATQGK